jgi:uncharacterized membrane protein YhaH (DUF805 family)
MFKDIFSYKGRIRRLEYGLTYLGYSILTSLSEYFTSYSDSLIAGIIHLAIVLPMVWILIVQGAKRCHDRGNSGWYQIIPFYVFWMLFANSDDGPNEYGDNPKGIGNYNEMEDIGKQITE